LFTDNHLINDSRYSKYPIIFNQFVPPLIRQFNRDGVSLSRIKYQFGTGKADRLFRYNKHRQPTGLSHQVECIDKELAENYLKSRQGDIFFIRTTTFQTVDSKIF